MIKLFEGTNEIPFVTTIFPDKTSQVWKVDMSKMSLVSIKKIEWTFENEGELMHVLQLATLVSEYFGQVNLHMPVLPYGRQDKKISNDATFALNTFLKVLRDSGLFNRITTVDAHSKLLLEKYQVQNIDPSDKIKEAIKVSKCTLVCFPDKGATLRGYDIAGASYVCLDKKRNQATGEIEGLEFAHFGGKEITKGAKILIVDDLCDGGRTFMDAAKLLKEAGAQEVYLYTTHGVYSKGTKILFDNGLDRVFNYNQEVIHVC